MSLDAVSYAGQPLPETLRKNGLAGESACPTKVQARAHQRGTGAFACQHCDPNDIFSASDGRGSDGQRNPNPSRDRQGAVAEES